MPTGRRGPGGRIAGAALSLLALLLSCTGAGAASAAEAPPPAPRTVGTASYNLYLGANLQPLFAATSQAELVQRAGETYRAMESTNFPERATAIADLLAARAPDVVGLQEVARWERGPLTGEPAVTQDFLAILLAELAERGTPYRAVAVNTNFTGQLPISATEQARFTDRDVIIVREGLPVSRLRTSDAQEHTFAAKLVIPSRIPGLSFTVPRGWSAVDVTVRGKTFRFANTHLEAFGPAAVRNAQAQEMAAALAASPYPVVLAGDLNSRPTDGAGAYGIVAAAGFADSWLASGGEVDGGWTSGQTDSLLDPGRITHRIDYVLAQPRGIGFVSAEVIGEEEADRSSPTGFWPSDHAGVVAVLRLARP
ncbi:endonuclease/exonuclease/phosphatase family protein [Streptomyces polyrhachis]|uniref:Endonuclease/exonuclease/phosphatase family protein n=1 Tax=Streptomyces polyrhachis TaxID=1282885 RepID=A0ABW2GE70_9ACTN